MEAYIIDVIERIERSIGEILDTFQEDFTGKKRENLTKAYYLIKEILRIYDIEELEYQIEEKRKELESLIKQVDDIKDKVLKDSNTKSIGK